MLQLIAYISAAALPAAIVLAISGGGLVSFAAIHRARKRKGVELPFGVRLLMLISGAIFSLLIVCAVAVLGLYFWFSSVL